MDPAPESRGGDAPFSLAVHSDDAAHTAPTPGFRARSDSLDIFTMSPLGTPPLDMRLNTHDPTSTLRLPDPPALDLSFNKHHDLARTSRSSSPSSTPNSPTPFAFSPTLSAQAYGGTSYGTDMTSIVGSWNGVGDGDDDAPNMVERENKGKGKDVFESTTGTALGAAVDITLDSAVENGKGKARAIDPPSPRDEFEFDFDFDSRQHSELDLGLRTSYAGREAEAGEGGPVVRLSPGARYPSFGDNNAGPSPHDEGCGVGPPMYVLDAMATSSLHVQEDGSHPPELTSASILPVHPSRLPLNPRDEAHEYDSTHRLPPFQPIPRAPTHRRSLSNLSLRSIRSSSSRSIASIRSAVISNSVGFRGRVKSMAPTATAKKLKGGLRKMFRRTSTGAAMFDSGDADTEDTDFDEGTHIRRSRHPLRTGLDVEEPDADLGQDHTADAIDSHQERRAFELHDREAGHCSNRSGSGNNSQDPDRAMGPHSLGPVIDSSQEEEHAAQRGSDAQATVKLATLSATVLVPGVALEHNLMLGTKPRSMSLPSSFSRTEGEMEARPELGDDLEWEVKVKVDIEVSRNRFDDVLPRELRLAVLRALIAVHETEHLQGELGEGQHPLWSVRTAARTRWAGRDKAVRELVKLSRVSKTWQSLVFDGQLWDALHLASAPPHLSPALLLRLAEHAGSFVCSLDLRGWTHLDPVTLRALVRSLSLAPAFNASPISPLATLFIAPPPRFPPTNLTHVSLRTCTSLTAHSLHHVLLRAPSLRSVDLRGLSAVTNTTCGVLATYCPMLEVADLGRCTNMDGEGLKELLGCGLARSWTSADGGSLITRGDTVIQDTERSGSSKLRTLRVSGLKRVDEDVLAGLAAGAPDLEVLDLSGVKDLTDEAIEEFVNWDESWDAESPDECFHKKITLSAREMGRDFTADFGTFSKRVTRLRHLNLSSCPLLTDVACTHLAHCVPRLEFLELAGIGRELKDDGLVRLLSTTPLIRRLDLEDACDITDEVLDALTPSALVEERRRGVLVPPRLQPGHALEQLVLSYASNITNEALLELMRSCDRLKVLECDNTRISGAVVKEFVKLARQRRLRAAELVAVDCRAITESLVRELAGSGQTRARKGYRHYEARALGYVDARDDEENFGALGILSGVGVDDCDAMRVALKSFWSWQAVDAVVQVREKRRKMMQSARRNTDAGVIGEAFRRGGSLVDEEDIFGADGAGPSSRSRWLGHWSRGSGSGSSSPTGEEDRACTVM